MEEFTEFLEKKKINGQAFKEDRPEQYAEWLALFSAVHPKSFTAQKLFLINSIRRIYPLLSDPSMSSETNNSIKPKVRPRPKPN